MVDVVFDVKFSLTFLNESTLRCLSTGACIDYLQRCDGIQNCPDASDETNCNLSKCGKTQFICDDLNCVDFAARCNGRNDCPDGSDESGCPGNYTFSKNAKKFILHSVCK